MSDTWLIGVLVALGGGLTTVMIELWRRRCHRRGDPPALTLPFCLITWGLVTLVSPRIPDSIEMVQGAASISSMRALALGLPHSFGQVFLCSDLASGWLVLVAVAVASPIAAALGTGGALIGMITALASGTDTSAVAQGLWGYNGVLVAIALGGIFHAPGRRTLSIALIGAGLASLLQALQGRLMGNLPPLTLSFVLTTWMMQRLAGRALPALVPVALHAVITPEEHRKQFVEASVLLGSFRRNLQQRIKGTVSNVGMKQPETEASKRIQHLFDQLDGNRDGNLRLDELRNALAVGGTKDDTQVRCLSSLNNQLATTTQAGRRALTAVLDALRYQWQRSSRPRRTKPTPSEHRPASAHRKGTSIGFHKRSAEPELARFRRSPAPELNAALRRSPASAPLGNF